MKKDSPHGKNVKLAVFFIIAVIILSILSLLWKLTQLIAASRYDGKHQFILEVESKPLKLVCFTPENHSVSILNINGDINQKEVEKILEIPVDAHIATSNSDSIAGILSGSIIHFRSNSDINAVDKFKLWWFLKSVHSDSLSEHTISLPLTQSINTNIIQKSFIDKSIDQESKSIQIINASGIPGIGNRLAKLLSDIGGNVIMINTAQNLTAKTTMTFSGEFSYTNRRIEHVLGIPSSVTVTKPNIADIIITIGSDFSDTEIF